MLTSTAEVGQPEAARATVRTGTTRVDYWRAGRGSPVLLLQDSAAAGDQHAPWLRTLAGSFRVFAPLLFAAEAETRRATAARLRSFLDGLGLERVAVVTDGEAAAEVLWLALSEPERIERVVIVLTGDGDPELPAALPAERLEQSRQPILIVRVSLPEASSEPAAPVHVHDRMLRFLSGEG